MSTFVIGSARSFLFILIAPPILGSHAVNYTDAARAWLNGADPWSVGPPALIFAGPPPMLLPFVGLVILPSQLITWGSVLGMAALAFWSIKRLALPAYWLFFPPLFGSILLGHPEVLVLALLVAGGAISGIASVIKPYAVFALVAENRWRAVALAAAVVLVTAPFLPWVRFIQELPQIGSSLARQAQGESTFGNPLLMLVGVLALARLGVRRGLWLATPIFWPFAQPGYRVGSVPALSPLIAACWALPIPGLTLGGVVLEAIAIQIGRRRTLPRFIQLGIDQSQFTVTSARP